MKLSGPYFDRLSDEDRLFASHTADIIDICERKYIPRFTAFLDGNQVEIARSVLGNIGFDNFCFYGGFNEASRCVLGVFPPYSECELSDFPITALEIRYRSEKKLSHRDFLGSFMSCGINRNMIGDIIVNDGYTVAFVYNTVADAILNEVKKIGSEGVKISVNPSPEIKPNESFKEISGTVSSLRADCVISLALKLSREKTAQLIRSGNVLLNSRPCESVSKEMNCGDIFSARGHGKFIFGSINGTTKKDRIHITIKKYI